MRQRWTTLFLAATVMMMGYVFWDVVSPLSTTLKSPVHDGGMAWTAAEYGFFAGSYSIFNIFLLMLFFGGIILDRMGIRFTGIMATGMMLAGAFVNYAAIAFMSPEQYIDMPFTLFGLIPTHLKLQVLVSAIGFGIFGVGCDITGITISKVVTKWFTGHELASAMGIQVAMARLGTASAISFSPLLAFHYGLPAPLLAGVIVLLLGFVLFIVYTWMDRSFDRREEQRQIAVTEAKQQPSEVHATEQTSFLSPLRKVLRNPGFWLIAVLCVFFYSSIRPFLKFATDVLVNKYGIEEVTAGWIVSILPYGTIILTPLFGNLYDRVGRGATLMLIGCIIVTLCHILIAMPIMNTTWMASIIMIFLGISFSLVPSAMWPSVPKIVPLGQLGTAYSIIYFIQNIGLMLVPMWVGNIIGENTDTDGQVNFTPPMLIFTAFGIASAITAWILRWMDKRKNYGLEKANEQLKTGAD